MKLVDMHCDTIARIYEESKENRIHLRENNFQLDLMKMRESDYLLQNFACFVNLGATDRPFEYTNKLIDIFDEEIAINSDLISKVLYYSDIENNIKKSKLSAMLTIEEGEACEGSIEKLEYFYKRGVRMMTLTWNYENSLAFPNKKILDENGKYIRTVVDTENGLKDRGYEFIERMEDLGMIIDVSHLNDAGIWDVLKSTKKPFVASHSNARALSSHPRNLSDEMIKAMANRGCKAGLNYYSLFLRDFRVGEKEFSYIDDCVKQAKYMIDKGGEDFLGLGSDYDGIDDNIEWENGANTLKIMKALEKVGFSARLIDKIMGENVLSLYKEIL